MEPGEMPEFKHPSVRLDKEDWACLHCWRSDAVPYTDMCWTSVKFHLKEKCVTSVPSTKVSTNPNHLTVQT